MAAAAAWVYQHGYVLYWGDAQAHLNASRSLIDSRTPGYEQLGTVWLPVLHVICVPLVGHDSFWSSGLAGTIPVSICFVVAGVCLYLAAREAYGNSVSAAIVLACFALNPNVLYLAAIPMTEIVFLAGLFAMLLCLLRFRATQGRRYLLIGIAASWWMSLTRYDGWFLIPFVALSFAVFAKERRWWILMGFGVAASLAPLYWMAHNWWETSNPLDFYNGPYSAAAIQGAHDYPGYHHWTTAIRYYFEASRLCSGWWLIVLGCAGIGCAIVKRIIFPIAFLSLTPVFYVWSVHSSKLPIHVPTLWPFSYYNNRYGVAVLALAAFAWGYRACVACPLQTDGPCGARALHAALDVARFPGGLDLLEGIASEFGFAEGLDGCGSRFSEEELSAGRRRADGNRRFAGDLLPSSRAIPGDAEHWQRCGLAGGHFTAGSDPSGALGVGAGG